MDGSVDPAQTTDARARFTLATRSLASARASAEEHHQVLVARIGELEQARVPLARRCSRRSAARRAGAERQRVDALAAGVRRSATRRTQRIAPPARRQRSDPTPIVQLAPAPAAATTPVHLGQARSIVSSTAYALSGTTATGLPVGQGMAAPSTPR